MKLNSVLLTFDAVDEIRRLPETWEATDYRRLLELLDIDDVDSYSDSDIVEVTLMALQDHEAEEAMEIVLTNFSDNHFSPGQIQNLREELKEECAWEEYPIIDHQQALYVCVDLLSMAFPNDYPEPAATAVDLTMSCGGLGDVHEKCPLDRATLLRAIGRCQDQQSILNRFFSEQINGAAFPEATSVIWRLDAVPAQPDKISVKFCGSTYWFRDLNEGEERSCDIDWTEV